jgi:hypothetical protein
MLSDEEKQAIRKKVSEQSGQWPFDLNMHAEEIERAVLANKWSQQVQPDTPTEQQVYRWFQESTINHHIEEEGGHISKRAMFVATKAWQAAKTSQQVQDVPEGCTVADAKKLREANHALAIENFDLKKKLDEEQASAIPAGYVHVDEVIQICKDFSSITGSIYIGDVQAALSGLSAAPKPEGE